MHLLIHHWQMQSSHQYYCSLEWWLKNIRVSQSIPESSLFTFEFELLHNPIGDIFIPSWNEIIELCGRRYAIGVYWPCCMLIKEDMVWLPLPILEIPMVDPRRSSIDWYLDSLPVITALRERNEYEKNSRGGTVSRSARCDYTDQFKGVVTYKPTNL